MHVQLMGVIMMKNKEILSNSIGYGVGCYSLKSI